MISGVKEVWLAVQPIDMRAGIDGLSLRVQEALGARAVRWECVRVSESAWDATEAGGVGRHGGVVMPAALVSGSVRVAQFGAGGV